MVSPYFPVTQMVNNQRLAYRKLQPSSSGTDWISIHETCRQNQVASMCEKFSLSAEERTWIEEKSRLRIPELEKLLRGLTMDLSLPVGQVHQELYLRQKTFVEQLISLKRRPKKRKAVVLDQPTKWKFVSSKKLLKVPVSPSQPPQRRLFHYFYHKTVSHPIDFTHPLSNYGEILEELEKVDKEAIPCLRPGCSLKCNREHFGWNVCEGVYFDWVCFMARYAEIAGSKDVNPKRSIMSVMYRFNWDK